MPKPDLSPTPEWRTVWPTQLRMLLQLQKRDFVSLGGIVGVISAFVVWGIFRTSPPAHPSREALMMFAPLAVPFSLVAAFWPLGVWRQESPERRGYFWSLPRSRAPHTLERVGAGWVTLMVACLGMMLVTAALLLFANLRLGPGNLSLARWYVPLATATLAYVLVSSLTVLVEAPVRALAWIAAAVFLLRIVAQLAKIKALATPIDVFATSLGLALLGPMGRGGPELVVDSQVHTVAYATWGVNYLVWIIVGAVALVAATFRYRDAR